MTNLDQFESEFRAAARTPFQYQPVEIALALLVTDLPAQNEELSTAVRDFLTVGREGPAPELQIALSEESDALGNLLKLIDQRLGNFRSRGGDDYDVERRVFHPALVPVSVFDFYVFITKAVKAGFRIKGKLLYDFN